VLKDKQALMISDVHTESDISFSGTLKLMKVGSVMCIPLISRSQIYGVIYVDTIDKTHGFRKEDLSLLNALSAPATLAIENSILYDRLKH
ncbi:MAG: GAF domain-containing protein, partial [Deltaproteobacteria bacterium]|nr:GAF domain-containing protein [Deltaproteobacteria bacterium]